MKTTVLAIASLLASVAITPASAQGTDKLNPGDKLPGSEITLQNANGTSTTLKEAQGENGLLVMFSCNTCPFVIKNQPITKKTLAYAAEHHIGVVIINSNEAQRKDDDSYDAMKKYAKEQGYSVPYVIDKNSELADMFGANHTPEVYLFNKQQKLVYKGAMNDNPANPDSYKKMYIEDAIKAMVAGKEVNPNTTKSIGCSIKRKA
jgi:cytochrome oxidase Cu insertion factor (SCO1/SenC/PrrC family)